MGEAEAEAEPVVLDLVQRAVVELMPLLTDPLSGETLNRLGDTLQAALSEALALGERHRAVDSETAREELCRVLAEMRLPPTLYPAPEHPRDPATGRWLTEGEAELVRRMQNLQGGQSLVLSHGTTVRPNPNLATLSRLLWLLDLSEGERAFVRAAADQPCDLDGLSVFADWLEEQQRGDSARFREVAAAGIRRLNPQPGEVYVIRTPPAGSPVQDDFAVAYLRGLWEGIANDATLIMLTPGESLSRLTDEQLAAAGLVRKDGLAST